MKRIIPMPQNVQPTITDLQLFSWMAGLATAAALFFLAWGVRDVKARFDKVPELEKEIDRLRVELEIIKERVND